MNKIKFSKETLLKKKVFIFDFDGTIANSNDLKAESFGDLYNEYGIDIKKKVIAYHKRNLGVDRYKKISYFHSELLGITLKKHELKSIAERFSNIVKQRVIQCDYIPGVLEFLQILKTKKIVCTINTATPDKEIVDILKKKKNLKVFFNC